MFLVVLFAIQFAN